MNEPLPLREFDDKDLQILALLPGSTDISLVVLKGHLLVEERIVELLELYVADSVALERARLTFAQRLAVLEALRPQLLGQQSALAIRKLNSLRNRLAHKLASEGVAELARDFVGCLFEAGMSSETQCIVAALPDVAKLRLAMAFLLGILRRVQIGHIENMKPSRAETSNPAFQRTASPPLN